MMSSAISMIPGTEEIKVRPAPDDLFSSPGAREGVSFATSLSERIGMSASSEEKQAANNLATRLSSLESATGNEKREQVPQTPIGLKEEPITGQDASVRNEIKCSVPSIQPQATVTGSEQKVTSEAIQTNASELPEPVKREATYGLSRDALAPGVTDQSPAPNVDIADGNRTVVPNSDDPVALKEPGVGKNVLEGGSFKKHAKAQEKPATDSTVQKTAEKIGDPTVVAPKPLADVSTASATPIAAQVELPKAVLPGKISKASDISSTVVSSGPKPSTGISPPAVNGHYRKEIASGANASGSDDLMMPSAIGISDAFSERDLSPQKMKAAALQDRSDGDNKQQVAGESGGAALHPAGIVSAATVPGDSLGEPAVLKQAVTESGFHSAGLATGSREQEGVGAAGQSVDGAPRMLSSTPTSLEVGIQNGTHGWLKVRAEMTDGGAVNASLSATSSVGQEMLHRELPALTEYLQNEKVAVNAIVVHSTPAAGSDARSSAGTDSAGEQTPQRNNDGERQDQGLTKTILNGSDERVSYRWHGIDEDGSLPLAAYVNGGSWLSVRA